MWTLKGSNDGAGETERLRGGSKEDIEPATPWRCGAPGAEPSTLAAVRAEPVRSMGGVEARRSTRVCPVVGGLAARAAACRRVRENPLFYMCLLRVTGEGVVFPLLTGRPLAISQASGMESDRWCQVDNFTSLLRLQYAIQLPLGLQPVAVSQSQLATSKWYCSRRWLLAPIAAQQQ